MSGVHPAASGAHAAVPGVPSTPLATLLGRIGAAAVDGQRLLDDHAMDRIERWDETGIPPSGFMWSSVTITAPVRYAVRGRPARPDPGLALSGGQDASGRLSIRLRFLPASQDDEPEVRP